MTSTTVIIINAMLVLAHIGIAIVNQQMVESMLESLEDKHDH